MPNICFLCASDEGIFLDISEDKTFFNKIETCLSLKASKDDALSTKICHKCAYEVDKCYDFVHKYKDSRKELEKSYKKRKSNCFFCQEAARKGYFFNLKKTNQLNDAFDKIYYLFDELSDETDIFICLVCRYSIDLLFDLQTVSEEVSEKLHKVIDEGIRVDKLTKTKTTIVRRKTTRVRSPRIGLQTISDTESDSSIMARNSRKIQTTETGKMEKKIRNRFCDECQSETEKGVDMFRIHRTGRTVCKTCWITMDPEKIIERNKRKRNSNDADIVSCKVFLKDVLHNSNKSKPKPLRMTKHDKNDKDNKSQINYNRNNDESSSSSSSNNNNNNSSSSSNSNRSSTKTKAQLKELPEIKETTNVRLPSRRLQNKLPPKKQQRREIIDISSDEDEKITKRGRKIIKSKKMEAIEEAKKEMKKKETKKFKKEIKEKKEKKEVEEEEEDEEEEEEKPREVRSQRIRKRLESNEKTTQKKGIDNQKTKRDRSSSVESIASSTRSRSTKSVEIELPTKRNARKRNDSITSVSSTASSRRGTTRTKKISEFKSPPKVKKSMAKRSKPFKEVEIVKEKEIEKEEEIEIEKEEIEIEKEEIEIEKEELEKETEELEKEIEEKEKRPLTCAACNTIFELSEDYFKHQRIHLKNFDIKLDRVQIEKKIIISEMKEQKNDESEDYEVKNSDSGNSSDKNTEDDKIELSLENKESDTTKKSKTKGRKTKVRGKIIKNEEKIADNSSVENLASSSEKEIEENSKIEETKNQEEISKNEEQENLQQSETEIRVPDDGFVILDTSTEDPETRIIPSSISNSEEQNSEETEIETINHEIPKEDEKKDEIPEENNEEEKEEEKKSPKMKSLSPRVGKRKSPGKGESKDSSHDAILSDDETIEKSPLKNRSPRKNKSPIKNKSPSKDDKSKIESPKLKSRNNSTDNYEEERKEEEEEEEATSVDNETVLVEDKETTKEESKIELENTENTENLKSAAEVENTENIEENIETKIQDEKELSDSANVSEDKEINSTDNESLNSQKIVSSNQLSSPQKDKSSKRKLRRDSKESPQKRRRESKNDETNEDENSQEENENLEELLQREELQVIDEVAESVSSIADEEQKTKKDDEETEKSIEDDSQDFTVAYTGSSQESLEITTLNAEDLETSSLPAISTNEELSRHSTSIQDDKEEKKVEEITEMENNSEIIEFSTINNPTINDQQTSLPQEIEQVVQNGLEEISNQIPVEIIHNEDDKNENNDVNKITEENQEETKAVDTVSEVLQECFDIATKQKDIEKNVFFNHPQQVNIEDISNDALNGSDMPSLETDGSEDTNL